MKGFQALFQSNVKKKEIVDINEDFGEQLARTNIGLFLMICMQFLGSFSLR